MFGLTIPIWSGSAPPPTGLTTYGYYDSDASFINEAPKIATWCASRLGFPIVDVELTPKMLYDCIEDAVLEYTSQVNQFNIRENMLSAQGLPTSSDLTQRNIVSTLTKTIALSKAYGSEVGSGGTLDWKKGYINIVDGTQDYNLNTLWAAVSESGERIEIKRIFHYGVPAAVRFYDPLVETALGRINLLNELGFGGYSPAIQFNLYPIFDDLLRIQQVEFNDMFRRSAYSFEIKNNNLRIFPLPTTNFKLWFEYILEKDRNEQVFGVGTSAASGSALQSDYSNIQYGVIPYSNINSVGRQWIRRYALANAKETLGSVRAKYQTIPIPDAEVTLDGDTLKSEGASERAELIASLRETLEETGRARQLEKKQQEEESLQQSLGKIPLKIYVG